MGFELARPEYYEGLKTFQDNTNQQDQLKQLTAVFLRHFKQEIESAIQAESITPQLAVQLNSLTTCPLKWLDLGGGDGTMTSKLFDAMNSVGYASPYYEAIEPDPYFRVASKQRLSDKANILVRDGKAFDGNLHESGKRNLVTAINSLYFANDLPAFAQDINNTLEPIGLGIFIQNKFFTDKADAELTKTKGSVFNISIPTEVYFPPIPETAWDLITNRASEKDIRSSTTLDEKVKADTITTKRIIDAMGGIATETEEGQKTAQKYKERILGNDFGGAGKYVSDNHMLVYLQPKAPTVLKEVVAKAIKSTQLEISAQQHSL